MKKIMVIDLESGPEPSEVSNGVIEFGYVDLVSQNEDLLGTPIDWEVAGGTGFLLNPLAPIPPETSAVHNLIDSDVRGKPKWADAVPPFFDRNSPEHNVLAYAAHSIEHETSYIGTDLTGDRPWLCTYKIALRLWPECPSHSNGGVRYFLNPKGLDRDKASPTHRAFPDAYVSAFTLREALNLGHSIETLAKWSSEPALLPRCKIGDYRNGGKGTPWTEVEGSFLHWILSKDFNEDTVHAVRNELGRRETEERIRREQEDLNRQFRDNGMSDESNGPGFAPLSAYEGSLF